MTVTCKRSSILEALGIIERFTGKNINLPIINNVLLKTSGSRLILQATNLESGAEISVNAKVIKEGSLAIPTRILSSVLQTITDENIVLKEKNLILLVETENTNSEIRGLTGSDFPIIPSIEKSTNIIIKNDDLSHILSKILPIISISDFKPEISGLYLYIKNKELVFVGTDTFRLFEERIDNFESSGEASIIIPVRPMHELLKAMDKTGETTISFNNEQVAIKTGGLRIVTRLINGAYPEYKNLIPKDFSTTLHVPKSEFLASARLSGVFASKLHDIILLYKKGTLTLEITNPEIGKHIKTMEADISGKEGRIGFNYSYLSDAVESITAETVTICLNDESRPAVLKDSLRPKFTAVVMPLRI